MTREEIQNRGLEIVLNNKYVVLELGTGVGKSKIVIDYLDNISIKDKKIFIVIAETNHKTNWKQEFKKWNKEYLLKNIKFLCYQSLHKHLDGNIYVFDEFHHLLNSEKRIETFKKLALENIEKIVGLSATLTQKQLNVFQEVIDTQPIIYKITLQKAIEYNILPEPLVYLVELVLDDTYYNYAHVYKKNTEPVLLTQKGKYDALTSRITWLKDLFFKERKEWQKTLWLQAASERKRFIGKLKTNYLKLILKKLGDKRILCFTSSIEQGNTIGKENAINSSISINVREEIIEKFNSGIINTLFTTKMLQEGQNLNNIEVGIITQLDNNIRFYMQVSGRVYRSLYPLQYILYFKGTQDEVYIDNVRESINEKYINVISLENI
jgi:superfamily II DNA or RNA helicase